MRIVIIGNSGSGKTWLAQQLAATRAVDIIHLDDIFWVEGGFDVRRAPQDVAERIAQNKRRPNWVVEGVFGDLAANYLDAADALVWLDLPWSVCAARLHQRGSQSKAHMDRAQSELGLEKLLFWASAYATREGDCSQAGHRLLFDSFARQRHYITDETQALVLARTGLRLG